MSFIARKIGCFLRRKKMGLWIHKNECNKIVLNRVNQDKKD